MLKPDYLKQCAEVLDSDASVVIAYPKTAFTDHQGNILEGIPDPGWDLNTEDVAVVMDANHLCVSSRGVGDVNSKTGTAFFNGKFNDDITKHEFLNYINAQ